MPDGQLFVLQILAATQPIAWRAALATAIPSAPMHRALMKSAGVRSPPVMMSVMSDRPWRSR